MFVRRLGQIETRMALMQSELCGTTQCSWMVVLDGVVTVKSVQLAAYDVFRYYQGLRCSIAEDEEGFFFAEHADWSRIEIISRTIKGDADVQSERQRLFTEEVNRPLRASDALWRLVVVMGKGETGLIITVHHSIVDGTCATWLLQWLLEGIDVTLAGGKLTDACRTLGAPIERYLRKTPLPGDTPSSRQAEIPFALYRPLDERRTAMISAGLDARAYRALSARVERDGVTTNSLIAAAMAKATSECGIAKGAISIKTAVSLRRLVPDGEWGCYLTVAGADVDAEGENLEQLAHAYHTALIAHVYERGIRTQDFSGSTMRYAIKKIGEHRVFVDGVGLTYLGTIELKRNFLHFRLSEYHACTNRNAGNAAFVLSVREGESGLILSLTFTEPLMERERMIWLGSAITRVLRTYAGQ